MSGAATGGLLAIRAGLKSAGKSALVGGVVLAAIEGLNIAIQRIIVPRMLQQPGARPIVDNLDPPTYHISVNDPFPDLYSSSNSTADRLY